MAKVSLTEAKAFTGLIPHTGLSSEVESGPQSLPIDVTLFWVPYRYHLSTSCFLPLPLSRT